MRHTLKLATLLALLPAGSARAQDACEPAAPLDDQRFLRRLSLDLRGHVPTADEIAAQRTKPFDPAVIDAWLASPEWVEVMRRHHASLLWPNTSQADLSPNLFTLYPYELRPGVTVLMSPLRAVINRTISGALYVPCKPEPARFDARGNLVADPIEMGGEVVAWQEGYVEVEPYWAPGTRVKVCGFDAQEAEEAVACPGPNERYPFLTPSCAQIETYARAVQAPFTGASISCGSQLATFAPGCGCGPKLARCHTMESRAILEKALAEQELRMVDRVIAADGDYTQLLLTRTTELNGPIAHYLRHQSRLSFNVMGELDASPALPADLEFTDADRWVSIERTARHAGVLTTPGYLLRFQSNRARAHRFYNAFECSSFIPSGSLPSPFEACSKHEDLTQRCGCNACHTALEPMAAHFGRFAEYGFTELDEARWPALAGQSCAPPIDSVDRLFRCFRLYELDPVGEEVPYRGFLNAYVFRTQEQRIAIEEGPGKLVRDSIASGRFASCTARRMWEYFMRRPPGADEEQQIGALARLFDESGHRLRPMVEAIVQLPAYRRSP